MNGSPTDPLSDDRLAEAAEQISDNGAALARLEDARARLDEQLARVFAPNSTERL